MVRALTRRTRSRRRTYTRRRALPRRNIFGRPTRRRRRRVFRRMRWANRGIIRRKYTVSFALYPDVTYSATESTAPLNPWHNDCGILFLKTPMVVTTAAAPDGGVNLSKQSCRTNGRASDLNAQENTINAFGNLFEDIKSDAVKYHYFRIGGMKLSYTPAHSTSGMVYVINKNDFGFKTSGFDLNPKVEELPSYGTRNTFFGICHDMTIGQNLDKCRKFPASMPFSTYFKRRVPRSDHQVRGGWMENPMNHKVNYDESYVYMRDYLNTGLGVFYLQGDDRYYHSLSPEARYDMAKQLGVTPQGTVRFTFYVHFKKKDNQFSTASAIIIKPNNYVATVGKTDLTVDDKGDETMLSAATDYPTTPEVT